MFNVQDSPPLANQDLVLLQQASGGFRQQDGAVTCIASVACRYPAAADAPATSVAGFWGSLADGANLQVTASSDAIRRKTSVPYRGWELGDGSRDFSASQTNGAVGGNKCVRESHHLRYLIFAVLNRPLLVILITTFPLCFRAWCRPAAGT